MTKEILDMEKSITNENIMMAAKQVKEILKTIPNEYREKIKDNFLEFLDEVEDKEYDFVFENIDKQKLLPETETMLQIIYRNYWCTPEEAQIIDTKMIENQKKYEKEQSEKYDINNIFNERKNKEVATETQIENNLPTVYKESIFTKILNFVRNIFKRRKK